jgi:DNA-binding CsgD family transcriptional regulator
MVGEDRRAVLARVSRLPRRAREVLVLRYYLGLSDQEIAAALGVSRGTVSSTASRALASLARDLKEDVAVLALVTGLSLARPQLLPGGNPGPGTAGPSPSLHLPSPSNQPPASQGPVPKPVLAAIETPAVDRTFVTAVEAATGCTSQLYQFRLNKQGAAGPLVPLHITVPGTYAQTGDLAVTPGGSTIAFATYLCDGHGELGVIDLATRHVGVWSNPSITTPAGLSLSADGGLLLYDVPGVSPEARILNTAAPAGSLPERSRVVSTTAAWTALAGNGDSLYGCAVTPDTAVASSTGAVTYYAMSLAGGQQHVVASWPDLPYPQCRASLDPSLGYLLVQYPANVPGHTDWVRPAILDLHSGRLTYIADPAFYGFLDIAW